MGAIAGHMLHPYEDLDLTFEQLKGMLEAASRGFPKLKVTEKTDGQNISISYDPRTDQALAIRNKSHAQAGGLDKDSLRRYFTTDRIEANKTPTPDNVVDSFYDAMENFEVIARSLPPEFFITPDGERIFYNAEVMDPRSANVVDYDTQVLLIHRVGHKRLSEGVLHGLDPDVAEQQSIELERRLEELQASSPEISTIKVNAIVDFTNFIEKKEAYRDAIAQLQAIQGPAETVGQYLENRILSLLKASIGTNYSEETYELILKAVMHFAVNKSLPRLGAEIKPVLNSIPEAERQQSPEKVEFIKEFLRTRSVLKDVVDRAMHPLMMIIHNFATSLLEGFIGGYALQADVSLGKLRKKVGAKARELADPADLKVLRTSLQKILGGQDVEDVLSDEALEAALERITTSVEGLVFDYDGKTYKFTGQFAPINQMLGLGKYDRGAKETVSEDLEDDDPYDYREDMEQWEREQYYADLEDEESAGPKTVVLFPGAFKPPHAGHYAAAKYYADNPNVDEVQVIISKSDRAEHTEKERLSVTPEISLEFWNQYAAGDSKIKPRVTTEPSPIRDAYKVMENMEPGSTVMFVMGEKDAKCGDERFAAVRDYALKHGLNYDCDPVTEKQTGVAEDLSATEMRRYVLAREKEPFFAQLPAHLSDEQKELIFNLLERGIQKKTNESISSLTDLRRLVEQVINEKYESKSCTKESGESGNCKVTFDDGHTACYDNCGVAKKATSGELNEDEIEEISAMGAGAVQGYAGPGKRDGKKKKNNSLIREDDEQYVKEVLDYILSRGTVNANRS